MSLFTEKHDETLLSSPWQFKVDSTGKRYLIKFAHHPDRPGYIFIATDLENVYFESLTTPALSSRFLQIDSHVNASKSRGKQGKRPELHGSISQTEGVDLRRRTEEELQSLGRMFGDDWEEVELTIEEDDYFDAVFVMQSNEASWIFNTTQLKGLLPLSFISRHLITPLTALIAQDRSIKSKGKTNMTSTLKILSDSQVQRDLSTWTEKTYGPRKPMSRSKSLTPAPANAVDDEEEAEEESYDDVEPPAPVGKESPIPERTPRKAAKNQTTSPQKRPSPSASPDPTPKPKHTRPPPSPSPPPKRPINSSRNTNPRSSSDTPSNPSPKKQGKAISDSPPPPSQSQKRVSQKSKKDKEREEEEEIERKRLELKRKMEAGSGGRLGRRRR